MADAVAGTVFTERAVCLRDMELEIQAWAFTSEIAGTLLRAIRECSALLLLMSRESLEPFERLITATQLQPASLHLNKVAPCCI